MIRRNIDSWSDYFKHFKFSDLGYRKLGVKNSRFISPKSLFIMALVYLLVRSIINIEILSLFIPLLFIYYFNLLSLKKLKKGLKVRKEFNQNSKEDRKETIKYTISNPYAFDFSNLILSDNFTGLFDKKTFGRFHFFYSSLPRNSRMKFNKNIVMNNGMGKKEFGPLTLHLTDEMGIHRLSEVHTKMEEVQVYPMVHSTSAPKPKPNFHSSEFGLFDSLLRGESVNFYRTREYQPGDNVKRINWKLSLKSQSLVINEFEDNSNAIVEIVLVNDNRINVGEGRNSTFEYTKDIALALCYEHIKTHNSIGLHTHDKYISPRSGKKHLTSIEMFIAGMELQNFSKENLYHRSQKETQELKIFKKRVKRNLSKSSNVFILLSLVPGKLWDQYLVMVEEVARASMSIHLVVTVGIQELSKYTGKDEQVWIAQIRKQLPVEINNLKIFCKEKNITLSIIDVDDNSQYAQRMKNAFSRV